MPSYITLGSRTADAATDTTGLNTGNLTTFFDIGDIGIHLAQFECYHAVVTSVPAGAQAAIYINSTLYSFTNPNGGSDYDPAQPMYLRPGDSVAFCWNITSGSPLVALYFRYDPAVPGNGGA